MAGFYSQSIREICNGTPFEFKFSGISVTKQYYHTREKEEILLPGATATVERMVFNAPIEIKFSNISELSAKGILHKDLELEPDFNYTVDENGDEFATAEINNSFEAVHGDEEFVSFFYITKQHGDLIVFIMNNPPRDASFYYLLSLTRVIDRVDEMTMPTGAAYSGDVFIKDGIPVAEGQGKARNLDGSSFTGSWHDNRPCGYGIYSFPDGDFHKGFFDDLPNGAGYLCLNTVHGMQLGHFAGGKLNGWAMSIKGGFITFGWHENGVLVRDCTEEVEWMDNLLHESVFSRYSGNMIQVSKPIFGYIRYGAPSRKSNYSQKPAIGYTFFNDGTVVIGALADSRNMDGMFAVYKPDGTHVLGKWKANAFVSEQPAKEVESWNWIQANLP